MPQEKVEASMRLFSKEVLPVIKQIDTPAPQAIPYSEWQQSLSVANSAPNVLLALFK